MLFFLHLRDVLHAIAHAPVVIAKVIVTILFTGSGGS
jgi:hypothetical protein